MGYHSKLELIQLALIAEGFFPVRRKMMLSLRQQYLLQPLQ